MDKNKDALERAAEAIDDCETEVIQDEMITIFKNFFTYWTAKVILRCDSMMSLAVLFFGLLLISRGHAKMGTTLLVCYQLFKLVVSFGFEKLSRIEHQRLEKVGKEMKELMNKIDGV